MSNSEFNENAIVDETLNYDTEEKEKHFKYEDKELDYECFDQICYWTYKTTNFDSPKQINPQDFRRLILSIIFSHEIYSNNIFMMDFINVYSIVVGTSSRVISIYYNRAKANQKQINTVETLETQMFTSSEGKYLFHFKFIHYNAVQTRQEPSKMLNFQDFQSEKPQKNDIQPFKIIEKITAKKEKKLKNFKHYH